MDTHSRFDDDQPTIPLAPASQGMAPQLTPAPAPQYPPLTMPAGVPLYQPPPLAGNATPPRRRSRLSLGCMGCLISLALMFTTTVCSVVAGTVIVWNVLSREMSARLQKEFEAQNSTAVTGVPSKAFQTTYVYDRHGNELHQLFQEGRRTRVKLAGIAPHLIDATIAVEDSTFYDNPGVDVAAITRAGISYFRAGGGGGASTITQQLVRNVVFDFEYRMERSARRKLEEVLMAIILTREKPKDDILELYLNTIYYGNLAYGVQAASQTYFGKDAKDLTLAEAALLAGLPQSPANYDPFNPDPAVQNTVLTRRNIVLGLMVSKGKITQAQADDARRQPLVYANPNVSLKSPHFTLFAEQELQDLLPAINLPPAYLNTGGLRVYTTLDPRAQGLAEQVARDQINTIRDKHNARNAAVVVLKPATGEILAMVGSVDYRDDSIDGRVNVTIAARQPGSAIKPLTYAAAMERGISPASIIWDVETRIRDDYGGPDYAPVNYDRDFHGPVRMRTALANSYNIPAVKTLRQIGVEYLLGFAGRLGVRSLGRDASQFGLSLTLGGGEVTPLELTRAYAVFANEGRLVPTTAILCVLNNEGQIVYQYENGCEGRGAMTEASINAAASGSQVLDPRLAFLIRDFLADNAARTPAMGARSPLRTDGILSSVKTGTTNNYRDNWTVGFTRNVAIGVWVGNTDSAEMKGTTGLTGAAPIWNAIITGMYNNTQIMDSLKVRGALLPDEITAPGGLSLRRLCAITSMREPAYDCERGRQEYVLDTPPMIPDENGNLVEQANVVATPPPRTGPLVAPFRDDPGVVQAVVFPLNPSLAASLVDPQAGRATPPPPLYCLVPQEVVDQVPGASPQLFIPSSPFADEDAYNRLYAQAAGFAILPTFACNTDMLMGGPAMPGVVARITWPAPGDTVTGTVYVKGIASWGAGQALYYKMELRGPQFPEWTTFGEVGYTPVINSDLGNFGAAGLQPGPYELRIIVVGMDANYLLISAPVPVNAIGQ